MNITRIITYLLFAVAVAAMPSCIEDGYTTSPSDQPTFSTDTLDLGVVFTEQVTPTARMTVYNPHSKGLNISNITLSGENADCFRINVDGISGKTFQNTEIRNRDSIFVMVEATLPPNSSKVPVAVEASLDFTTNGVTRSIVLRADGQNVERLKALTLSENRTFTADIPYVVYDSIVVPEGITMTVQPGASLLFHDKASLIVRGTLVCQGTPEQRITLGGDRTGILVGDIGFDIMSRQWTGVFFTATSTGNRLSHTDIINTVQGVAVSGDVPAAPMSQEPAQPQLELQNCRLRNSAGTVLESYHGRVRAVGCEFAEGGGGLVYLHGGTGVFNHCTFANYYLFSVLGGPALGFGHISSDADTGFDDGTGLPYLAADFSNSIIYGNGTALSHGDLTGTSVFLRRCLIKGDGTDDDNFLNTLWDADPLYYTVREEYHFDYRLRPESPAIGAADPQLTLAEAAQDGYGLLRGATPDLGAYVYVAPTEDPSTTPK